jgi:hypothetical protein
MERAEDLIWRLYDSACGVLNQATRPAICYRNRHLRRRDTNMDDMRETFSKLKKDIKHRITGKKRKADKARAGGRGERADVSGSPSGSTPDVVTGSDREQGENESGAGGEDVEPSVAANEKKSGWKSTASSSAKLLLLGVRDSADAFGPLKSVAGGLCFILENCEVCLPPHLLLTSLIGPAAHEGEQTENRIVGTQSQSPRRSALRARR